MRSRRGFTLVELLVVVSIVAVLMTLTAAVLQLAKGGARVAECAHNLRQVWSGLSVYAQEHYFFVPKGDTHPDRLPAATAEVFWEILDGQIELLYCRTYPRRAEYLAEWRSAIEAGNTAFRPHIGYLYLAGSRFEAWDVPNEELADDFRGARRIESVGEGVGGCAEAVWMVDFARCTTSAASGRNTPKNWDLASHPPQRVVENAGRSDYRLPDGANVLFEDGHVTFRPFERLRPRLIRTQRVFCW